MKGDTSLVECGDELTARTDVEPRCGDVQVMALALAEEPARGRASDPLRASAFVGDSSDMAGCAWIAFAPRCDDANECEWNGEGKATAGAMYGDLEAAGAWAAQVQVHGVVMPRSVVRCLLLCMTRLTAIGGVRSIYYELGWLAAGWFVEWATWATVSDGR